MKLENTGDWILVFLFYYSTIPIQIIFIWIILGQFLPKFIGDSLEKFVVLIWNLSWMSFLWGKVK
jgi:uncharacterized membrane protein YkgB